MSTVLTKHNEALQGTAYASPITLHGATKLFYIESYGCAMNFADSEVVAAILQEQHYAATKELEAADLIFINTCSIREKAEQAIRKRLTEFKKLKKAKPTLLVGVLGCMAERLKEQFITEEKLVDLVIGPDAYRSLPTLIKEASLGHKGINVLLSREETYANIEPVRLGTNGVSAYVSIMRGCNNMCSFCVVPFTRGRERSRDAASIVAECTKLYASGYKEITLLGQNVDSYLATTTPTIPQAAAADINNNNTHSQPQQQALTHNELASVEVAAAHNITLTTVVQNDTCTFAQLLAKVASISPRLRVRFSTSHPKDITDDVLHTMAKYHNICKHIHLPVQSGSTRVLQLMNRTYTREWYMGKINKIRAILPTASITSDIIAGFCTETEADHQDTISLMQACQYQLSYMYYYSERPGTLAARRFDDDVPLDVKKSRLQQIIDVQGVLSLQGNLTDVGKTLEVLIDGDSKKSTTQWAGRTEQNRVVIFDKGNYNLHKGDYVLVHIRDAARAILYGSIVQA